MNKLYIIDYLLINQRVKCLLTLSLLDSNFQHKFVQALKFGMIFKATPLICTTPGFRSKSLN